MKIERMSFWFGLSGVSSSDSERAKFWGRRLDHVMIVLALVTLPLIVVIFDQNLDETSHLLHLLQWVIVVAFTFEFLLLATFSNQRGAYIFGNWLNLLIIFVSILSILGLTQGIWLAIARALRMISLGLVAARALSSTGKWLIARGIPIVISLALVAWLISGLCFYYLEPTINSFGEGLWLAFVSASTVGYGDIVPTTGASRLFAAIMVFIGFGFFSMVVASISAYFVGEEEKVENEKIHDDIRELRNEIRNLRQDLDRFRT